MTRSNPYDESEVTGLIIQARTRGLAALQCPRDGKHLRVRDVMSQPLEPADRAMGLVFGNEDILRASVRCPMCRAEGRMDLRRGDQ